MTMMMNQVFVSHSLSYFLAFIEFKPDCETHAQKLYIETNEAKILESEKDRETERE